MSMVLLAGNAYAFGELAGSCESDCQKCHSITDEEAAEIVKSVNPEIEIIETKFSEVRGLWQVTIKARGKRGIAYIDFSKKHIITGSIINIDTKINITNKELYNLTKIDVSQIPLEDALFLGKRTARFKAIVFDDPECPYCRKLHRELWKVVEENEEVAFYIKLLPLKIHPASYKKAKAIVCERSIALLERAFDGRELPEPSCETTEVDETIELAEELGISSAPTIVLPDGGTITGTKGYIELMDLIEKAGLEQERLMVQREGELEQERTRQRMAIQDAALSDLRLQNNTVQAYDGFLQKYPDYYKKSELLAVMAGLIAERPDLMVQYKEFLLRHPEGLAHIAPEYRIHFIGPKELPVYKIEEMLEAEMSQLEVAEKVRAVEGMYENFSLQQVSELEQLGIGDSIVEAMLEVTYMAKKREEQAVRAAALEALKGEIEATAFSLSSFEDMLMTSVDPEDMSRGNAAYLKDDDGVPLMDKIATCKALIDALNRCSEVYDVSTCAESSKLDYICQ